MLRNAKGPHAHILIVYFSLKGVPKWEFPRTMGVFFGSPYNKDPTI